MIRFFAAVIVLAAYLILLLPVLLILLIVGKFNQKAKDIISLRIVQSAFRAIIWCSGAKITVIGEENVPQDRPVLYIGNHRSYFDILMTYVRCKGLTGYVSKKEMDKFLILNIWMRYLHCLFLDRENIREGMKTILKAIEYVKQGISIFIFPEGTRNKADNDLEMMPFHEGSFKIAQKTGCPIVPVAINNSAEIFENHLPKLKPCHVIIEYGKPIMISELSKEDQKHVGAYTQNIILETLKKNQKLI